MYLLLHALVYIAAPPENYWTPPTRRTSGGHHAHTAAGVRTSTSAPAPVPAPAAATMRTATASHPAGKDRRGTRFLQCKRCHAHTHNIRATGFQNALAFGLHRRISRIII